MNEKQEELKRTVQNIVFKSGTIRRKLAGIESILYKYNLSDKDLDFFERKIEEIKNADLEL